MQGDLPSRATVVVIGAGVIGASVAYHLAKHGCSDVVVLERSKIGSGTTWHSAGNMEAFREDPVLCEMITYGIEFFPKLQAETGQELGWRGSGRVMIATTPERMDHYRSLPALGHARGLSMDLLSPTEVVQKLPILERDGIMGGLWVPSDGTINPTDLVMAYCKGARNRGVRMIEDEAVLRLEATNGRISAVHTASGEIKCDAVVLAAGMWSSELAATLGTTLPMGAAQHFYLLTESMRNVRHDMPLFLCLDERFYGREEVGGLLLGFFDADAIPISPSDLPAEFAFGLLESNWDQIQPNLAIALQRFPELQHTGIRLLLNGPESFTPDMNMLLGEIPGTRGCFVATAMNSSGIGLSASVGRLTAEWILNGIPSLNIPHLDVRRFLPGETNPLYLRDRMREVVTHMCRLLSPGDGFVGARDIRRSPLHDFLSQRGARFGSVGQWEIPLWMEESPSGDSPWVTALARELSAAENNLLIVDRSHDCKFMVDGPGASGLVARLSGAVGNLEIGQAVTAPMLNEQGGVEANPTIVRTSGEAYLLVADARQTTHLKDWIERNRSPGEPGVIDITASLTALAIFGPKMDYLFERKRKDRIAENITIGYADATIMPFLETAGWYVLIPSEAAKNAFSYLLDSGRDIGLVVGGSLAINALLALCSIPRVGAEVTAFRSVVKLGLDERLDINRNQTFIGRAAVMRDRAATGRCIRQYALNTPPRMSFDNLPLLWMGQIVGCVTSGAFIPAFGGGIVTGLLDRHDQADPTHILLNGAEIPLQSFTPAHGWNPQMYSRYERAWI